MTSMTTRQDQVHQRLAALSERIDGIKAAPASHDEKNRPDLATRRESAEVPEHIGSDAQAEIRATSAALARIADLRYGRCQRGAVISAARLDLLPATPFCKDGAP